eukprot:12515033-Alexandrium_andersonii.AAC.1
MVKSGKCAKKEPHLLSGCALHWVLAVQVRGGPQEHRRTCWQEITVPAPTQQQSGGGDHSSTTVKMRVCKHWLFP